MMRASAIGVFGVTPALALALALGAGVAGPRAQESPPPGEWRAFEGSWSAVGRRRILPTGGERPAAVIQLSGPVVLTDATSLGAGFYGEAIGFDDGRDVVAGSAVWTDGRGGRVFSVLRGGSLQTGRRMLGTITGGTGPYAGVVGEYQLTWQYVVQGEEDVVQGRSKDLRGRFRLNGTER